MFFFVLGVELFVHLQNLRHFRIYKTHFPTASAFRRMVGVLVMRVLSLFSFSLSVLSLGIIEYCPIMFYGCADMFLSPLCLGDGGGEA